MESSLGKEGLLKLLSAKRRIEECLRTNGDDLSDMRDSRAVSVHDLLKESLQIQFNCHAPKEYTIGMPLFRSHPPAPQPEEMRVGSLPLYNQSSAISKSSSKNTTKEEFTDTKPTILLEKLRNELQRKRNLDGGLANYPQLAKSGELDSIVGGSNNESSDRNEDNSNLANKKARTVNISFGGLSDSDDEDD